MKTIAWMGLCVALAGCGSLKPTDFNGSATSFQPDVFFTGHVQSWGVIENRGGHPKQRFTTDCVGRRGPDGDLELAQTLHFDNGKTESRAFHIRRLDDHHFAATGTDVVGTAYGEFFGNAFHWKYLVRARPGNPFARVAFDQWMYMPEGTDTMFTHVMVTKLGLRLAEVTESFHRVGP